jgi:hypothetical protein
VEQHCENRQARIYLLLATVPVAATMMSPATRVEGSIRPPTKSDRCGRISAFCILVANERPNPICCYKFTLAVYCPRFLEFVGLIFDRVMLCVVLCLGPRITDSVI